MKDGKLLIQQGVAVAAMALLPGLVQAETWKFAIEEIPGSIMDAYAQEFKSRIEERSDGEVTVSVYPLGSLGTPTEVAEMTASGVVQFANLSVGNLGTLVPESQLFLLPYALPSDSREVSHLLGSSPVIHEQLAADFADKDLELHTLYSEGAQVWTTNREIRTPGDFENFKMRVMVSPVLLAAYEDMGASPTPMPFGEVYGALQLKQVDGQVNPISAIEEMKFYEVTDYLIWAGEQELVTAVLSSDQWFASLSPERRQLVSETIAGMQDYIHDVVQRYNREKLEAIQTAKPEVTLVKLNEEERDVFRQRTRETDQAYLEITGTRGETLLTAWNEELTRLK
ncbi:MAG: TRAP transporter substrate-binding protein DctP [Halomonas sp.]|nr:TRAP transporter substrate-binding protein DctP [Halomonas sp.]